MKHTLIYTIVALMLSACTATPTTETIDDARRHIDLGHPDRAAETIGKLAESSDSISVDQLIDIAILLIQAAEDSGNEEYIAQATRCYRKAFANDSVAATAHVDSLPTEDTPRAALLEQLRISLSQ